MRTLKVILISLGAVALTVTVVIVGVGFFLSPQDQLQPADVIVAVSGGETQQRTREAVRLYQHGYAPKLLFSGAAADKNGPSNAAVMRSLALDAGVPAPDILVEEVSTTTAENAVQSAPIIKGLNAKTVIMVTSPYHQRRASMNFRQILGPDITIINHSAVDSAWRKNSWWRQPYTLDLTISELQKTIYVYSTKPEAQQ
jgi:uncharacterized SAM-binding protein YcdF (DUF218 family)